MRRGSVSVSRVVWSNSTIDVERIDNCTLAFHPFFFVFCAGDIATIAWSTDTHSSVHTRDEYAFEISLIKISLLNDTVSAA